MSYIVQIRQDDLIEALENKLENVYENIDENDEVEDVYMKGSHVYIVIGGGK